MTRREFLLALAAGPLMPVPLAARHHSPWPVGSGRVTLTFEPQALLFEASRAALHIVENDRRHETIAWPERIDWPSGSLRLTRETLELRLIGGGGGGGSFRE